MLTEGSRFRFYRGALCAMAVVVLCAVPAHAVIIDWVSIGNPGNAGEVQPPGTVGAVPYSYSIGKYEVTNNQYVEFLNAKDPTGANTLGLYNSNMTSFGSGGINYTAGNPSGSKYSVKSGHGNQPMIYVSWYDAIRFANWLHNGQGAGDTETGAYTLLGGTLVPSNGSSITRNAGAKIFLPSDNEWYKAAYHKNDGATANYWDYPTGTNVVPNSDQSPGALAIQTNVANFYRDDGLANGYNDGYAITGGTSLIGSLNYLTDVGAYTYSPSPYGTFDQGGSAWEWNETLVDGAFRALRGGGWGYTSYRLSASYRDSNYPTYEYNTYGFRVAMIPEPTSSSLAVSAALLGLWWPRRRKR